MRIALCLQGLSSGYNEKNNPVSSLPCLESIKSNIISINDNVDIFIHTWNEKKSIKDSIKHLFKKELKNSIFEKQIIFEDKNNPPIYQPVHNRQYHVTKSRWYSQMKSIELKKQYEKENNFTYNFVMISRFDCLYYTPIDFTTLDPTKFYASHWEGKTSAGVPHNLNGFLDYWFIANSSNMDLFGDLYNKLDEYLSEGISLSNHVLSKYYIEKLGLTDNISYMLNEHKDFNLNRNY